MWCARAGTEFIRESWARSWPTAGRLPKLRHHSLKDSVIPSVNLVRGGRLRLYLLDHASRTRSCRLMRPMSLPTFGTVARQGLRGIPFNPCSRDPELFSIAMDQVALAHYIGTVGSRMSQLMTLETTPRPAGSTQRFPLLRVGLDNRVRRDDFCRGPKPQRWMGLSSMRLARLTSGRNFKVQSRGGDYNRS